MAKQTGQGAFETLKQLRAVREFEVAFREATGLCFNLKGLPPDANTPFIQSEGNPVCALVCSTEPGRTLCRQLQAQLRRKLERERSPQQLQCLAGLRIVAVPVVVSGALVGVLHTNRLLAQIPSPQAVADLTRRLEQWGCESPAPELAKHFGSLPVVSEPRQEAIIRLLQIFAEHLGDLTARSLLAEREAGPSPMATALEFVREHQSERLRLSKVAQQARLSSFYFCKLFHKTMGMTFSDYVGRQRVERAKDLLLSRRARVADVASNAGFGSVAHFNRAFKRYAGMTPTAYRRAHLAAPPTPAATACPPQAALRASTWRR
jgi:AraC-like DNA-binding protein